LYITTNGTDISGIIPFADKFERLEITVSVDNINEKFELERYGAKWDNVANNIQQLISLPTVKIGISTVVSIQNVYYIPEFLDWINSINVDSTYFYYISDPKYQSISKLTPNAKKLVLGKLTAIHNHKHQAHINDIVEIINVSLGSDGQEFVNQMKRLDQIRNQDFSKTHPEIAKAMGYE
jgi:MoaA/NifB/PqqE/SkfB family radical SAM enzyme